MPEQPPEAACVDCRVHGRMDERVSRAERDICKRAREIEAVKEKVDKILSTNKAILVAVCLNLAGLLVKFIHG